MLPGEDAEIVALQRRIAVTQRQPSAFPIQNGTQDRALQDLFPSLFQMAQDMGHVRVDGVVPTTQ